MNRHCPPSQAYDWRKLIEQAMCVLAAGRCRGTTDNEQKTISKICMHYPEAVQYVLSRFDLANVSLKAGIIAGFYGAHWPIPGELQSKFVAYAESRMPKDGDEAFDEAVLTLAFCTNVQERASKVLVRCLSSRCWRHRGNAAVSLAMLGDIEDAVLQKIAGLVYDREGCMDWTVRSAALSAIRIMGARARAAVPLLQELSSQIDASEQYCECDGELLANAFEAIADADPVTVDILIRMVNAHGLNVPWHAMLALSRIAEVSPLAGDIERAMKAIGDYAHHEDATEYLDKWADLLQIAMITIGGADHPECHRVHAYLRTIQWLDQDRHIQPFAAIFTRS